MNTGGNNKTVCFNSQNPGKLVKWKVRSGSRLCHGTILLLYEVKSQENDEKQVLKLKSKDEGTVEKLLVKEGGTLEPGAKVLILQDGSCTHSVVMKDLCAECGADLRQLDDKKIGEVTANASVSMIHSVPELRISEDQAQKLGKADQDRLLKARKLVLLVDLDQTLIHTTNEEIHPNMKDVFHFQLYGPRSPWYHTKLRPGTDVFLEKISKLYELHIFTFGARPYAHHIACLIDPQGKYFSHRILSRDECFSQSTKSGNLKALFPCGDSMVCIIDDREDVWNFAPNMVPVKPYHFFSGTGDINAPPGLTRKESKMKNSNQNKYDYKKVPDNNELSESSSNSEESRTSKVKETSEKIKLDSLILENIDEKVLKLKEVEEKNVTSSEVDGKMDKSSEVDEKIMTSSEVDEKNMTSSEVDEKNMTSSEVDEKNMTSSEVDEKMDKSSEVDGKMDKTSEVDEKMDKSSEVDEKMDKSSEVDEKMDKSSEVDEKMDKSSEVDEKMDKSSEVDEKLGKPLDVDEKVDKSLVGDEKMDKTSEGDEKTHGVDEKMDKTSEGDEKTHEVDEKVVKLSLVDEKMEQSSVAEEKVLTSLEVDDKMEKISGVSASDSPMEVDSVCTMNGQATPENEKILSNDKHEKSSSLDNDEMSKESGEIKTDDSTSLIEAPEDDYLLYLEEVLTMIHRAFYDLYDQLRKDSKKEIPDLKMVIPYVRRKVLQNVNVVFSGVIPTNMEPEKSKLWMLAKSLGANIQKELTPSGPNGSVTTHLIAAKLGTIKVLKAKRMKGVFVVNPNWLYCCAERWEKVDERLYPLTEEISKNPFAKFKRKQLYQQAGKALESNADSKNEEIEDDSKFSSSYSPLLSFSTDEITKMGQEVDDACSEESENEPDDAKELGNTLKMDQEEDSSSNESLSGGEFPKGWKRRKKCDENETELEDCSLPSKKEEFGGILESEEEDAAQIPYNSEKSDNSESDEFNDSIGSADEEMAAAVEREFLN